jgi:adenosylmethionine-8-amino-7-oxononanoate aminotransferase
VDQFEQVMHSDGETLAGAVIEPRIQGAAGMITHPEGYAERVCKMVQECGGKVILDEVMTGFYRTGAYFAYHKEHVKPDLIALAKGLTGGYLPLAATLIREEMAEGFRGGFHRTFYHGHSYSGNQLGCVAALASMDLLGQPGFLTELQAKIEQLRRLSERFWQHPNVGDVRQEGFILAIELVADFETRARFEGKLRMGFHVCEAAKRFGLLTRPIGDVLMLMPPYCTTKEQLEKMVDGLYRGLCEVIPV